MKAEIKEVPKLKSINIKGNQYVMVNERIKEFRNQHQDWTIQTEITNLDNGMVVMKALIIDTKGRVISTGHAYEKEDNGFINKTSYIENCETSAVGRALANFGIGIDTSVASFEEVATAMINQDKDPKLQSLVFRYDSYLEMNKKLIGSDELMKWARSEAWDKKQLIEKGNELKALVEDRTHQLFLENEQ